MDGQVPEVVLEADASPFFTARQWASMSEMEHRNSRLTNYHMIKSMGEKLARPPSSPCGVGFLLRTCARRAAYLTGSSSDAYFIFKISIE